MLLLIITSLVILFVLKLYIAVLSGSLAVIASVLDSALDLLSGRGGGGSLRVGVYPTELILGTFFFVSYFCFTPAEATGLGFVCFVVIKPRVLSGNSVDLDLLLQF